LTRAVAKFAADCAQNIALNLQPWQDPPCVINFARTLRLPYSEPRAARESAELRRHHGPRRDLVPVDGEFLWTESPNEAARTKGDQQLDCAHLTHSEGNGRGRSSVASSPRRSGDISQRGLAPLS
jgi:hypothetical protein